ncbi:MAG: DUF1573 domain-containing protein, partial [Flavobacteriales bacterium]|nr:DUF1573 domain-containing protein [Flavobacteriales bacterium]
EFVQLPFGEYQSDKSVSDDLVNERASIYSRAACMERKIEIELVTLLPPLVAPDLQFDTLINLGHLPGHGIVTHSMKLRNLTTVPVQVDTVGASCGCTTPQIDRSLILPGDEAELTVGFDPEGKKGPQVKEVYIHIHGEAEPRVIRIEVIVD